MRFSKLFVSLVFLLLSCTTTFAQDKLNPDAVFTHVMSAKRDEKPRELGVYDRAKRRSTSLD